MRRWPDTFGPSRRGRFRRCCEWGGCRASSEWHVAILDAALRGCAGGTVRGCWPGLSASRQPSSRRKRPLATSSSSPMASCRRGAQAPRPLRKCAPKMSGKSSAAQRLRQCKHWWRKPGLSAGKPVSAVYSRAAGILRAHLGSLCDRRKTLSELA